MKEETLKAKIRERYGKIALSGNSDCCCTPQECCNTTDFNPKESLIAIGYNNKELETIPESSLLGLGCGAPLDLANLKKGEIIVDLGSGGGIDAFLASKRVGDKGKVIGIDFTNDMLDKARNAALKFGFSNVEFSKGDIEKRIPIEDSSADVVISNCVINLTTDKVAVFKEVYRILKKGGKGRMVISDLVTSKEVQPDKINTGDWCSCIDGALTRENYINAIQKAGFEDINVLKEQLYLSEDKTDGSRRLVSLIIGAVTG
ncbi:MAG TPA: arsenite methyltransferase [Nitrososphaeraceae archaeon]|jgi:SAM-dependent methyltransferase